MAELIHGLTAERVRANVRGLPPNRAVYEALDVVEAELGRVHALPESAGMATGR